MIRLPIIRLLIQNRIQNTLAWGVNQISTQAFPLQFKATPALCAEPMKRKKKIDPAIIKAREEKKKKRIEKEIKKLQKIQKQCKPIAEFGIPNCLFEERERRKRNISLSENDTEERILLLKEWSKTKSIQFNNDLKEIERLMKSQKKALSELRLESEELYQAAVKIDENLIPLKFKGPAETPPINNYVFPDGVYKDVSKKWE